MRLLFGFVGGRGHLDPLVPLARAARERGHDILFACAPAMAPGVEAEGFTAASVGAAPDAPPSRRPLRAVDRAREDRDLRVRFAERAARARWPQVRQLAERWRPGAVVCDGTDFGAMLAAEELGIPFATIELTAPGFVRAEVVGEALDAVRAEGGLPPDPTLRMLGRHRLLSPFPPALEDVSSPSSGARSRFRVADVRESASSSPPIRRSRPEAPLVYFTLGTVFNLECGDLFERVVTGLRELPIELVVTVGDAVDPAELGPQPDHVHVERFVPQRGLLPHCGLVVCHAGSGSVLAALAHGLPSVLIPLGADQPLNAERCEAAGVSRVLDAMSLTPREVAAGVEAMLVAPEPRRRAGAVRDEIAAMPSAAEAVEWIEALAQPGARS